MAGLETSDWVSRLADEVVAIDGCEVGCAKKTLEAAGVTPNRHVVVSDLGIEKTGDLVLRDEEIDRVLAVLPPIVEDLRAHLRS